MSWLCGSGSYSTAATCYCHATTVPAALYKLQGKSLAEGSKLHVFPQRNNWQRMARNSKKWQKPQPRSVELEVLWNICMYWQLFWGKYTVNHGSSLKYLLRGLSHRLSKKLSCSIRSQFLCQGRIGLQASCLRPWSGKSWMQKQRWRQGPLK